MNITLAAKASNSGAKFAPSAPERYAARASATTNTARKARRPKRENTPEHSAAKAQAQVYIPAVPAAASIARPKAVPAAAPAKAPPLSAAVSTSSSASTRPRLTVCMNSMRARLISAQAASIATAAPWRFSASSVAGRAELSASRKKYVPPAHSAASAASPGSSVSSSSPEAAQLSAPVAAMTTSAQTGATQGERAHLASCTMNSSVNATTHAAA